MALFRKLFYKKPPDGLLEICDRVYVFDYCFTNDEWQEQNYRTYMGGIIGQLKEHFPDASFLGFNFREENTQSQLADILSEYDMTIMEYPWQYEGCPILTMEVIHHFLKSGESWLSLGQNNLLLMHCERAGWLVLAFMLAALLIYRKQYSGEHKTLDMIYRQAPRDLLQSLSPVNPVPSQLRYLQYISRRNLASEWPPLDRSLTLDCIIFRFVPDFDGEGGCRPVFRIYGHGSSDKGSNLSCISPSKSKPIRSYKQAESELIKIDVNCHVPGDVVLECTSFSDDLEHEKMMFRVAFNTAFIRSNILILNRDEIDIPWDSKNQYPKDFRAEIIFSEMDAIDSVVKLDFNDYEVKEGLPVEAFSKVREIFSSIDWCNSNPDLALNVLQQMSTANAVQEKSDPSLKESTQCIPQSPPKKEPKLQEKKKLLAFDTAVKNAILSEGKINPMHSPQSSSGASVSDEAEQIYLKGGHEPQPLDSSHKPLSHDDDSEPRASANQTIVASSGTHLLEKPHMKSNTSVNLPPSTPPIGQLPVSKPIDASLENEIQENPKVTSDTSLMLPPSPPIPPPPMPPSVPPTPPPPPTPPLSENCKSSIVLPPPPPSPLLKENGKSSIGPPPPPPPPLHSGKAASITTASLHSPPTSTTFTAPPPPPPPASTSAPSTPPPSTPSSAPSAPPPPPPPSISSSASSAPPPPPPPSISSSASSAPPPPMPSGKSQLSTPVPPSPSLPSISSGSKGRLPRTLGTRSQQTKKLKPLHWLKLTRAVQGSLWAETQKSGETSKAPEIDMSELENLFAAPAANSDQGRKSNTQSSRGPKVEKVHLIEHRRAYNCEIMLSKVKVPLNELTRFVLALEDSVLDVDQVENLIKFCPTKEEIELLKNYTGVKEKLGKCEQFFMELMQVPRIESKLRVFSFKMQFHTQISDLRRSLNVVNSATEEIRSSEKLKRIMQTILSLGNALNQGTARGSAIGFRLDSLLKLTDTRAKNNKITLMHYLCKVLADKLPELLDFSKELGNLEPAERIQLKAMAEEMQAISKGLEKTVQELSTSESDGPISENFCKILKEFLRFAEAEVRSLASLYSGVGRNVDALILYFGEDPARCPFEQVVSTLLNFVRVFNKSHDENCKQLELEMKKTAEIDETKIRKAEVTV